MANQLDNQPYTELSEHELSELDRQISSLIGKSDGQQKLQELIAERDFRRTHGTTSEKMYFIDNEIHDIEMKLSGRFRLSNPSDRKRFYELRNRHDELLKEKTAVRFNDVKKLLTTISERVSLNVIYNKQATVANIEVGGHQLTIKGHLNALLFDGKLLYTDGDGLTLSGEFESRNAAIDYISKELIHYDVNQINSSITYSDSDFTSTQHSFNYPKVEPQKKDSPSVGTSNLNELQEELARATEALDDLRDFMPAQPTSEYLNQMQEAALRVEKLQKEINSIKGDLPLQTQMQESVSSKVEPPEKDDSLMANDYQSLENQLNKKNEELAELIAKEKNIDKKMDDYYDTYGRVFDSSFPEHKRIINQIKSVKQERDAIHSQLLEQQNEKPQKEINPIKGDLPLQAQTNTSISKFSISPLPQPINGSVAVCSATFYNTLTVNGITINNGRKGLYVKMPQKRTKQGRFLDVCHPLSAEGRQAARLE